MPLPNGWSLAPEEEQPKPAAFTLPEGWSVEPDDTTKPPAINALPEGWSLAPESEQPKPTPSVADYLSDIPTLIAKKSNEAIGQIVSGAGTAVRTVPQLAANLSKRAAVLSGDLTQEEADARARAGMEQVEKSDIITGAKGTQAFGQELGKKGFAALMPGADVREYLKVDPRIEESLPGKIAGGAATMIPAIATGPAAPVAMGLMMGEQGAEDARQAGATPEQEAASFAANAAVGTISEAALGVPQHLLKAKAMAPIVKAGEKIIPAGAPKTAIGRMAKATAGGALREGSQEGLEQLSTNEIAKDVAGYDPERDRMEGVAEAALIGGITGGALSGTFEAAHEYDTAQNVKESTKTLRAQQEDLIAGKRTVQMFPVNTPELELPKGFSRVETERGVFHYDPTAWKAETITALSAEGKENLVLGLGSMSKPEVQKRAQQTGEAPVVIVERRADGTEVKAAVGTTGTAEKQKAEIEAGKADPTNKVTVESINNVVQQRKAGDFIGDLINQSDKTSEETRARDEAELAARKQRQEELDKKKDRFSETLAIARTTWSNPAASYSEINGALESMKFYAEDNAIGITSEQRRQAEAAQKALTQKIAPMQVDEDARREKARLQIEADAKAQALAEKQRKAEQRAAMRQAIEDEKTKPNAEGKYNYPALAEEKLYELAQNGDPQAEREIMERESGTRTEQDPDLLETMRKHKIRIPTTDTTLQGEIDALQENVTPREWMAMATDKAGAHGGLDYVAERLREHGFSAIKTPADLMDHLARATAGEDIRPTWEDNHEQSAEFATAKQPAQPTLMKPEELQRLEHDMRQSFPALFTNIDLQIGQLEELLHRRDPRIQVPEGVEGALVRQRGRRTLMALQASSIQNRGHASGLMMHETAHAFWDTLPDETKAHLRSIHAEHTSTKTGPIYKDGKLQSQMAGVEDVDSEHGHKEWFSETLAAINKEWALGRINGTRHHSMIRQLAAQLRDWFMRTWTKITGNQDMALMRDEFRKFVLAGARQEIGPRAGLAYAQGTLALDQAIGLELPNAIRNITPRWQERSLQFESHLDKALYYVGATGNTATRQAISESIQQQTGLSAGRVQSLARELREHIRKTIPSSAGAGTLRVPPTMRETVARETGVEYAHSPSIQPDPRIDASAYKTKTGLRFENLVRGVGEKPNDHGVAGKGPYFSYSERAAKQYAGKTGKVVRGTVELERPLVLTYRQLNDLQESLYGQIVTGFDPALSEKFNDWLHAKQYDGVVIYDLDISRTIPEEVVKLAPRVEFAQREEAPKIEKDVLDQRQIAKINGNKSALLANSPEYRDALASLARHSSQTADMFLGSGTISDFLHLIGLKKPGHIVSEYEPTRAIIRTQIRENPEQVITETLKAIDAIRANKANVHKAFEQPPKNLANAVSIFNKLVDALPAEPNVSEAIRRQIRDEAKDGFLASIARKAKENALTDETYRDFGNLRLQQAATWEQHHSLMSPGQDIKSIAQAEAEYLEFIRSEANGQVSMYTVNPSKPVSLEQTPKAAGWAIANQIQLGSNDNLATNPTSKGVLNKPFTRLMGDIDSGRANEVEKTIRELAPSYQGEHVLNTDSWSAIAGLAYQQPGIGFILDPSYFSPLDENGNRKGTSNYNYATEIQTPDDLHFLLRKFVFPVWEKGSRFVLTNEWDERLATQLRDTGLHVIRGERAGGSPELIVANFDPATGEIHPPRFRLEPGEQHAQGMEPALRPSSDRLPEQDASSPLAEEGKRTARHMDRGERVRDESRERPGQDRPAREPEEIAAELKEAEASLADLANSQEEEEVIRAQGMELSQKIAALKRELVVAKQDALVAESLRPPEEQPEKDDPSDLFHPLAKARDKIEPGDSWASVAKMDLAEIASETTAIKKHLAERDLDEQAAPELQYLHNRLGALEAERKRKAADIIAKSATVEGATKPSPSERKAKLLADLERGHAIRDDIKNVGAQRLANEIISTTEAALDKEFPGWRGKQSAPTPAPTKAAAPSTTPLATSDPLLQQDDGSNLPPEQEPEGKSPFDPADEDEKLPLRKNLPRQAYGQTSIQPGPMARIWERFIHMAEGWRGPIPELPTFPSLDKTDRILREKGAAFYNRVKEFYRFLHGANDSIQYEAAEQLERVIKPLMSIKDAPFNADEYARLKQLTEQMRKAEAEGIMINPDIAQQANHLRAKMEEHPYVLFQQLVMMLDFRWRAKNMQDSSGNSIKLPFGMNMAEVEHELGRLQGLVNTNAHAGAIQQALQNHQKLVKGIYEDLKRRELVLQDHLANPFYFPHLTLQHNRGGTIEQRSLRPERVHVDLRQDFRSYLQTPIGSETPIEGDYLKAMYHHLVQVGAHNTRSDAVQDYIKPYDILPQIKAEAKKRGVAWEVHFHREYAPLGYVIHGLESTDAFPVIQIDRDKLARSLGVAITGEDIGEQLKRLGNYNIHLTRDDIQQIYSGGQRETWVLPVRVADALNGIERRSQRQDQAIETAFKKALGTWKAWKLFMPWNHVRYEFGNVVADVGKIFSASPSTVFEFKAAHQEIRDFWQGGAPSDDLRAAIKHGVINTITAQEMKALSRLPQFNAFETSAEAALRQLKTHSSSVAFKPIAWALGANNLSSVELSAFREAIFRYANYKASLKALRAGVAPDYAGAYKPDVDSIGESRPGAADAHQRKAAAISLATFGNYGDISVNGQYAREKLIPFYSWLEVNFKYHANLLRNMRDMVTSGNNRERGRAAAIAARLLLPLAALALWNNSDDREEMENELSVEDRRRTHLIVGRNADGNPEVIYLNTAIGDIVRWFSGQEFARQFMRWQAGHTDFTTAMGQWLQTIPGDFSQNTIGNLTPALRTPASIVTGRDFGLDPLHARKIPAYDFRRAILSQITDNFTADMIERTINADYVSAKTGWSWAKQIILQMRERDPESWAFYAIKDKAEAFAETKTGRSRDSSSDAPDSQAVRNFKRAIYRGDVEQALTSYNRLVSYGYTAERMAAMIRAGDPLQTLPKELRAEFVASLAPDERVLLRRAMAYATRLTASKSAEVGLFPKERYLEHGMNWTTRIPQKEERLRAIIENREHMTEDQIQKQVERDMRASLRIKR
jgi:hypothetical protein